MFLQIFAAGVAEPLITFSLIFGGCCSNALTLELITSQYPPAGTLVTFAQFLLVALVGLRKQLVILPTHESRADVLKHVIPLLTQSVNNVAVYGPNIRATLAFAHELAKLVKSEAVPADITEFGQVQNGISTGTNESTSPAVSTVLLRPSTSGSPITFRIVLQESTTLSYNADLVLDISDPDHPSLLHPRVCRFTFNPFRYRLKRRRIPLTRYVIQVLLFLLINLLNNAAFAYHVPMAVHIIFRSGGLVVNMLMGWLFEKRRYTKVQICSVVLVTVGIALTTLSSTQSKSRILQNNSTTRMGMQTESETVSYGEYAIGIGILTLALVFSGFLGLAQDSAFKRYGRGNWEEAMFYLHTLSLPLFAFTWRDLTAQVRTANAGPQLDVDLHALTQPFSFLSGDAPPPLPYLPMCLPTLRFPAFYVPLLLNILTQLVCVTGVNRLTAHVGSLTVTLVLVVRKAVSLAISVLLLGSSQGNVLLWLGASTVLVGTVGYAMGSRAAKEKEQ